MQVVDAQVQNLIKITKVRKGSGVACVFSNQLPHVLQARNQGGHREGEAPPENFSTLMEKFVGYILKLSDIVNKCGPLSENSSPLLVSQAGYGPDLL